MLCYVRAVSGTPHTSSSRAGEGEEGVDRCDGSDVLVGGATGYLSPSTAHMTGYGTRQCPWLIRAPRGQHIQLTLYDFSDPAVADHHHRRHHQHRVVTVYALASSSQEFATTIPYGTANYSPYHAQCYIIDNNNSHNNAEQLH